MPRDVFDKVENDINARREIRGEETKENSREDKPEVYVHPVCISVEQMFNIINEKLDLLIQNK